MNIRTISQLNKIKDPLDISNESLMSMSLFNQAELNYSSKAVSIQVLSHKLSSDINTALVNTYGLTYNGVPIKSTDLSASIFNILSNDIQLGGIKTFIDSPIVPAPTSLSSATNKKYVDTKVTESPIYIKPNGLVPNAFDVDNTPIASTSDNLLHWELLNYSAGKVQSTVQTVTSDGNLVCYGWVTAAEVVEPAAAWVALEGKINGKWIILQLSPWITGSNSTELQYVSFNAPVKNGLQLRLTTGFNVNYNKTTYQNRSNTLVYNVVAPGTSITNAFIGYILG